VGKLIQFRRGQIVGYASCECVADVKV
jgi:hypothetical protein